MNLCLFGGNLTRKPELKHVGANQVAVANFTIAVNRKYKDKDGSEKKEATFIDCEAWDSGAETISKYCDKGDYLIVYTTAKLETWEDKNDGSKRSKMKFRVDRFEFAGGGKKKGVDTDEQPTGDTTTPPATDDADGGDIPF